MPGKANDTAFKLITIESPSHFQRRRRLLPSGAKMSFEISTPVVAEVFNGLGSICPGGF